MYTQIEIKADGSSLFRAVATGILMKQNSNGLSKRVVSALSSELRQKVVDRMERKSKTNKSYLALLDGPTYLKRMRKRSTRAGVKETTMLHKLIRAEYKRYFPGGLAVHVIRKTNAIGHHTEVLVCMTGERNDSLFNVETQLNVIMDTNTNHFDLLWLNYPKSNVSMLLK